MGSRRPINFIEDAKKIQADLSPGTGEEVTTIVKGVFNTPEDVIAELRRSAALK